MNFSFSGSVSHTTSKTLLMHVPHEFLCKNECLCFLNKRHWKKINFKGSLSFVCDIHTVNYALTEQMIQNKVFPCVFPLHRAVTSFHEYSMSKWLAINWYQWIIFLAFEVDIFTGSRWHTVLRELSIQALVEHLIELLLFRKYLKRHFCNIFWSTEETAYFLFRLNFFSRIYCAHLQAWIIYILYKWDRIR